MLAQRCRDIRQYLRKPNELFRRVRDEHGQLHLSKRAAAYHPGQGVYRSSYKNARRLAVTETNMAYNTSDHLRWQQLDFVVGIEVRLSGNHTCLGGDGKPHKFTDICDELAGKYPKTFKFTGWHPQCRCIAISILKTQEEMDADTQKILNGEPIDGDSVNTVEDVPQAFKDWCAENSDRIDRAAERGTLPYFLRDNKGYMDNALSQPKQSTILERAAARHAARTPEQAQAIQDAWNKRKEIIIAKEKFQSYDEKWEKAYFSDTSGGFNVYHKNHQFANTKANTNAKMTGGEAEKFVGKILANNGKQLEFLPENGKGKGKPDTAFDSLTWDIKYISWANENTIRKYIEDARKADCVIFYWDEANKIDELKNAVKRTIGKFAKRGELESLPKVYYISDKNELLLLFNN